MKRAFAGLLLLLQVLAVACADAQPKAAGDGGQDVEGDSAAHAPTAHTDVAPPESQTRAVPEPGADLVDAAWTELRRLSPPSHTRRPKRPSIAGYLIHYALKAVPTLQLSAPTVDSEKKVLSGGALEAVEVLEDCAQRNNSDALYLLAQMNFYGNFSHPMNFKAAFHYYHRLATLNGNSSALHMIGLLYSTGVGGAVERDQARALLYYTFAANSGNTRAEMTVAFRHHTGIATPKDCDTGVKYYKRVADKAVAWYRSGPPGGETWIQEAYRIADDDGGVYGEGASAASSGGNARRAGPTADAHASIEDVIEYLDLMSQKGDFKASFNLGRIYHDGQRGLERDLDLARKYFFMVTHRYWKRGRVVDNPKPGLDKYAAKAAGYIGRMFLRGEGVEQNLERAKFWFDRGITHADAQSQYGLALMHLEGYGVPKNIPKASELFKVAADQDFSPAQIQLGALYLDQGHMDDIHAANHYFELAARYGSLEAFYYLAEMSLHGVGRDKSCSTAAMYYKLVAEKAEPLTSSWAEANIAYENGDHELAFLEYLGAAEQGYERAQNNVAHMLDPHQSRLPFPEWLDRHAHRPALLDNPPLALIYWTRSSKQSNIDSLVKMGDYYLQGIGTDVNVDKAVQCYQGASEYHQSAQALYNLGWMHENGVGLDQDFHLAKRYYDLALETNMEAYLPVTLSLLKLRARSAWNTFTHGKVNSIQDEPVAKKDWSLSEWVANFIQDDQGYYDDGYDDLFDDTIPGGDGDLDADFDDSILESLLILGLAAALIFLVMYRNQRQQQARRQEEERQRQQGQQLGGAPAGAQAGGGLPQPGDPRFGQWPIGGIGH